MNDNYTALFRLVQAAMGNNYSSLPDNIDWEAVVALAARHGVGALTLDGLNALYQSGYIAKEQIPSAKVRAQWGGHQERVKHNYRTQTLVLNELDDVLGKNNSKILVFKGYALSQYFPTPMHREFGDIDMCTLNTATKELKKLILSNGGVYDHGDTKHFALIFKGIPLELHNYFVYKFMSKKTKKINALLTNELHNAEILNDYKNIYKPNLKFDLLFILLHAANHFKNEGIVIRHILDWAIVLKASNHCWNETLLEELGLLSFGRILNRIAKEYLGFDIPERLCLCDDEWHKMVLNDILYTQNINNNPNSKLNIVLSKYKRLTSRKWTYKLFGDNFGFSVLHSIVEHLKDPSATFR